MRLKERIPVFIEQLNESTLHKIFIDWFGTNFEKTELLVLQDINKIECYWLKNHDLRFTQVLVNMGYIPNTPGFWYYSEDDEVLLKADCDSRDILFWGQNYDKDMNRLPETNWILIKNMNTDHIKAVIAFMGEKLPSRYKTAFSKELERRNE